jgi:hypothetical protein
VESAFHGKLIGAEHPEICMPMPVFWGFPMSSKKAGFQGQMDLFGACASMTFSTRRTHFSYWPGASIGRDLRQNLVCILTIIPDGRRFRPGSWLVWNI